MMKVGHGPTNSYLTVIVVHSTISWEIFEGSNFYIFLINCQTTKIIYTCEIKTLRK